MPCFSHIVYRTCIIHFRTLRFRFSFATGELPKRVFPLWTFFRWRYVHLHETPCQIYWCLQDSVIVHAILITFLRLIAWSLSFSSVSIHILHRNPAISDTFENCFFNTVLNYWICSKDSTLLTYILQLIPSIWIIPKIQKWPTLSLKHTFRFVIQLSDHTCLYLVLLGSFDWRRSLIAQIFLKML